jgi:hypothetical protein
MKGSFYSLLSILALLLLFLAVSHWSGIRAGQAGAEGPPVAYAWGSQVSVYYPSQKKIYVYSELGGNCVYTYTLSTPGGPVRRENCK